MSKKLVDKLPNKNLLVYTILPNMGINSQKIYNLGAV